MQDPLKTKFRAMEIQLTSRRARHQLCLCTKAPALSDWVIAWGA